MLENDEQLTREDISTLLNFQDDDGGFRLIVDNKMPWDGCKIMYMNHRIILL